MKCMINKQLKKIKKNNRLNIFKIEVIRRYLRMKIKIDKDLNQLNHIELKLCDL